MNDLTSSVEPASTPASTTLLPLPTEPIPEALRHPTFMKGVDEKITLLLKPYRRAGGGHIDHPTAKALKALKEAVNHVARGDASEAVNADFYNRLVNQVICGTRDFSTLCAKIDGVGGICYEIARPLGIPSAPLTTVTEPPAPKKRWAF